MANRERSLPPAYRDQFRVALAKTLFNGERPSNTQPQGFFAPGNNTPEPSIMNPLPGPYPTDKPFVPDITQPIVNVPIPPPVTSPDTPSFTGGLLDRVKETGRAIDRSIRRRP